MFGEKNKRQKCKNTQTEEWIKVLLLLSALTNQKILQSIIKITATYNGFNKNKIVLLTANCLMKQTR